MVALLLTSSGLAMSAQTAPLAVVQAATGPASAPAVVLAQAAIAANPELLSAAAPPAAVRLRGRVIFEVTTPLGTLSPAQRAAAIETHLLEAADAPAETPDHLRLAEGDDFTGIYDDSTLIRAVTDLDAAHTGRTRQQLAADQLVRIRDALAIEYHDRGLAQVLRGLFVSAIATVVFAVLLFYLRWLYRWTGARITRAAQAWHWSSGLASLKLLSPAMLASSSRSVATTLAWLLFLSTSYGYLEFVLSQFLWTRGLAVQMLGAAQGAVEHVVTALIGYLPNLLNIVAVVVIARFFLKALKGVFEQISAGHLSIPGFYREWGHPTFALVRFFVIAIAFVMVFPYLPGSGSAGFQGVATFVGLALSFGGAPAIGNMIVGVIITYMRPFGVGDRVKIADAVGDVMSKNLLLVRLRTIKNVDISIPNALVLANQIVNFSANAAESGLVLHTTVTIGFNVPWRQVHQLLIDAARRVEGVLAEPAPFVLQTSLDDFYVAYEINAYTDQPNEQAGLYSRLHAAIQDTFNEGGVEILSPHYGAVRDGNTMGLPPEYLPKDYKAPGFSVLSTLLRPGQGS
jgi:small-conductance mechanosensitive channel